MWSSACRSHAHRVILAARADRAQWGAGLIAASRRREAVRHPSGCRGRRSEKWLVLLFAPCHEPRRPGDHHVRDLGRARQPRAVPGDPLHAAVEDFRAITGAIRAELGGDDVIVNYSTGAIGVLPGKRIAYLRARRAGVAALNMGSMNWAIYSAARRAFVFRTGARQPVRRDHRAARGHERARHPPRAPVLRRALEDNLCLPDGELARSNGDLVARPRRRTPGGASRPSRRRARCSGW